MRKSEHSNANVLQTVFFDWRIIPHATVSKHTQITTSHWCNKYTSNMAAVIFIV